MKRMTDEEWARAKRESDWVAMATEAGRARSSEARLVALLREVLTDCGCTSGDDTTDPCAMCAPGIDALKETE